MICEDKAGLAVQSGGPSCREFCETFPQNLEDSSIRDPRTPWQVQSTAQLAQVKERNLFTVALSGTRPQRIQGPGEGGTQDTCGLGNFPLGMALFFALSIMAGSPVKPQEHFLEVCGQGWEDGSDGTELAV